MFINKTSTRANTICGENMANVSLLILRLLLFKNYFLLYKNPVHVFSEE